MQAFFQSADALDSIGDPVAKGRALAQLYWSATSDIRPLVARRALKAARMLLYYGGPVDTALLAFHRSLLAEAGIPDKIKVMAALQMAGYHGFITYDPDSTGRYIAEAERYKDGMDDSLKAQLAASIAQLRQLQGRLFDAIASHYEGIEIDERLNDSNRLSSGYLNLANIYRQIGNLEESEALMEKSIAYQTGKTHLLHRLMSYGAMADDLIGLGRYNEARGWLNKAAQELPDSAQYPELALQLSSTCGQLFVMLEHYDSAIIYYNKSRALLHLVRNEHAIQNFKIMSTMAYVHQRDVSADVDTIKTYIPIFLKGGDLIKAKWAYHSLATVATVRHQYAAALEYTGKRDSTQQLIAKKENQQYLAEMEAKYQNKQKALQILLQSKDLKRKTQLVTILALSLVAAALLAIGIITAMKLSRTRREARLQQQFTRGLLLKTEEERSRIAAELHDGISHDLLALKAGKGKESNEDLQRIDAIINNIRRISRNLHPAMLNTIGLEASIQHLCHQLTESGALFVTAEISCPRRLSSDLELQLFRIVQECLTNCAKYAAAVAAKVNLSVEHDVLTLTVQDNGRGFNVAEKLASKNSFGLHSIIERGKAIGGKTTITSSPGATTIHLQATAHYAKHDYHSG